MHKYCFGILFIFFSYINFISADEFNFDFLNADTSAEPVESFKNSEQNNIQLNFVIEQTFRFNSKNSKIPKSNIPLDFFYDWNNRITLSSKIKFKITDRINLNLYDRLNYIIDDKNNLTSALVNNDVNELFFNFAIDSLNSFNIGRINMKNGAAIGFNPTDFLKKYAGNEKVSDDPIVLRENRLGVLMASYQNINKLGAISVAAIPSINTEINKWHTTRGSFPLNLNKTNNLEKYIVKLELNTFNNVQPELLYISEKGQSGFGANISSSISDNIIIYAEWSGTKKKNILMETILKYCYDYGISKDLPETVLPDFIKNKKYKNEISAGFSYTEKKYKRTTYIEYHYNQNGVNKNYVKYVAESEYYNTIKHYFNQIDLYMPHYYLYWATRDNSNNLMEPYYKKQLFFRNQWFEAFHKKINLVTMIQYNLIDNSYYSKFILEYNYNNRLIFNSSAVFYIGDLDSEYGGLPESYNIKAGCSYYF